MFSKNQILKSKLKFVQKKERENEFTVSIQINANHTLPNEILQDLERQVKNIQVNDYSIEKDVKK